MGEIGQPALLVEIVERGREQAGPHPRIAPHGQAGQGQADKIESGVADLGEVGVDDGGEGSPIVQEVPGMQVPMHDVMADEVDLIDGVAECLDPGHQ